MKLQTYTADTLTLDCDNEYFQIQNGGLWDGQTLYKLYQSAYTPWEWHAELFAYAKSLGLLCFSTPFDDSAVDFLESLDNPIYKIASFEINDIPLIRYAARKGKPMILSTGIASLEEIREAVDACFAENNRDITLLACTSAYPTPLTQANLVRITDLKARFELKIGLSDHTMGDCAAVVASVLGATLIEKHFILDRALGGADSSFSMQPDEFAELKQRVYDACDSLGAADYGSAAVAPSKVFKRSLFVCEDMRKGEAFNARNVRSIRPGYGIAPKHLPEILSKTAAKDIARGQPLNWELVSPK